MRYDILYLEDDPDVHELGMIFFEHHCLRPIDFFSGVQALKYLQAQTSVLPLSYLCDMRIPGSVEELDSPLAICQFVSARGSLGNFRFHTGHVSDHDQGVLHETSALVIVKTDLPTLHTFLEGIRAQRDLLDRA